jgi:hypothetical protein
MGRFFYRLYLSLKISVLSYSRRSIDQFYPIKGIFKVVLSVRLSHEHQQEIF